MNALRRLRDTLTRSVLGRFFVNALVVIVLPFLFLVLTSQYITSNMTADAIAAEQRALGMTISRLDDSVAQVQITSAAIAREAECMRFAYFSEPLSADARLSAFKMVHLLAKYGETDNLLYSVSMYFPRSGRVISDSGMYTPEEYFRFYIDGGSISYEDWSGDWLKSDHAADYRRIRSSVGGTVYREQLHLLASYHYSGSDECAFIIDIVLDPSTVKGGLEQIREGGAIYIENREGDVLLTAGDTLTYGSIEEPPDVNNAQYNAVIGGESVHCFVENSDSTGWKYKLIVPNSLLIGTVYRMKALENALMYVAVGTALLCSLFITWLSYKPIRRLKETALIYSLTDTPSDANEIDIIHHNIQSAYQRNRELTEQQQQIADQYNRLLDNSMQNRDALLDGLLLRVMRCDISDWRMVDGWLAAADIRFDSAGFIVALLHISQYGSSDEGDRTDEEKEAILTNVGGMFRDMGNTVGFGYSIRQPGETVLLLLNTDEPAEEIARLLIGTQTILRERKGIVISIGLGDMVGDIRHIQLSYRQAEAGLEYRFVKGKGLLITGKEASRPDSTAVRLSDDFVNQISSALVRRDSEQLEKLIERLNREYTVESLSMFQAQSLYYSVMNIMMNTLAKSRIDVKQIFGETFDPLEEMTSCETIGEVIEVMEDILRTICEKPIEPAPGRSARIVEQALDLINENFCRAEFSQQWVADRLGISTAYLSRSIKQETGRNMVDILNILRVEKARRYLLETDMSLSEIADGIGFISVKSLTRIFRQYVGMTPGELRSQYGIRQTEANENEEEKDE